MTLCECGCGVEVKNGKRFVKGHNARVNHPMRNPEIVEKIKGIHHYLFSKKLPEKTKRKISEKLSGENHPMFGKHHTQESKDKNSNSNKKYYEEHPVWNKGLTRKTNECIRKYADAFFGKGNPMYGKHHTEDAKHRISDATKGENNPMYGKRGKECPSYGRHLSNEAKRKLREKRMKQRFPNHHTKPELKFKEICKNHNIDFHYVGDGELWIGKRGEEQLNPDFIEANGKKLCVEIFGEYFHSPLLNQNLRENQTLNYRLKFYRRYNWKPIFIWAADIMRPDGEEFVLNILRKEEVIK